MFLSFCHSGENLRRAIILLLLTACIPASAQRSPVETPNQFSLQAGDTTAIRQMIGSARKQAAANPDSAVTIFKDILERSRQIYYARGIIEALIGIGLGYGELGMFTESMNAYRQAIVYAHMSGERGEIFRSNIENNIANLYNTRGNYRQAAQHYYQAAAFAERQGQSSSAGIIYNNLASVLLQMDQARPALYYLDKAEKTARRYQQFETLANILVNKGNYYRKREQPEQSGAYYKAALEMGRKSNSVICQYLALVNLGGYYLTLDSPRTTIALLKEAAALKQGSHINAFIENTALVLSGEAHLRLKDYGLAESFLLSAIKNAQALNLANNLMETHKLLADLYTATGRYRESVGQQHSYFIIRDSLQNRQTTEIVNRLEMTYRTAEKDRELIGKQLLITQQEKYLARKNMLIVAISAGALLLALLLAARYRHFRQKQQILLRDREIGQLKAMMAGEEKERARIARELHDGIGSMLAAIKMNFGIIQEQPDVSPHTRSLNGKVMKMIEDTAGEVRKTAHNLMPDVLTQYNLEKALTIYCDQINVANRLQIDLQFLGALDLTNKASELLIYRMIQELIQNILKHSCATQACIMIKQWNEKLSIIVEDNGTGFDMDEHRSGFGLQNLQFRVQALRGMLSINSGKGRGTIVHIIFDMNKMDEQMTN